MYTVSLARKKFSTRTTFGMIDLGERAAFLEKALHAVAERREVLGRARAHDVALGAQHQRRRQVFLDRDRRARLVERAVDDRKAAAADLPVDPVVQQLVAAGKGLVGDGHRGNRWQAIVADHLDPQFACQQIALCLAPRTRITHTFSPDAEAYQQQSRNRLRRTGVCRKSFPMILSMTGFAAAAAELPGVSLAVELRSVNHRYLDVRRLPDELRTLETALRERWPAPEARQGRMPRRADRAPGAAAASRSTSRVSAAGDSRGRKWSRAVPGAPPLSVNEILRWPACSPSRPSRPELAAQRIALVEEALRDSRAPRAREGAKIARCSRALRGHRDAGRARAPRMPAMHAAYSEKLGARLREAGLDPERGPAEAGARDLRHQGRRRRGAGAADDARQPKCGACSQAGGSAGKRLDFLAQELHREANTLGSKSVDAEVSQAALELKVLIEQMREQVQNRRVSAAGEAKPREARRAPTRARASEADTPTLPSSVAHRCKEAANEPTTSSPPGAARFRLPVRRSRRPPAAARQPREGVARARAGHAPVRVVHDARAASRRADGVDYHFVDEPRFHGAEGQRRIPRARVRPRQLVRDVGDVARAGGRTRATTCCSRSTGRARARCGT